MEKEKNGARRGAPCGEGILSFMSGCASRLSEAGREGTSRTYVSTMRSLSRFLGGRDVPLRELNPGVIKNYETYLLGCGVTRNTVSFYMRTLRTACRQSSREGLAKDMRASFGGVYTGFGKTRKRSAGLSGIRAVRRLDLSGDPKLAFARDMFVLSFYLRGMPFVDLAHLRKSDLMEGRLRYERQKTRQTLSIEWTRQMQEIVRRYAPLTVGSPYLLPILRLDGSDERKQYDNALRRVNRHLRQVGRLAGVAILLSTYVARHTWASVAHALQVPVQVISEGLGHDCELTTQIYIASLDDTVIDRANHRIISAV